MIKLYTDGSCHPQLKIGAWAAIILGENETILQDSLKPTTNNQMELIAAIQAIQYVHKHFSKDTQILLHLDSQYVLRLPQRAEKLRKNAFQNKKGNAIPNQKYVQEFLELFDQSNIEFVKIQAHLKKAIANPYHRKVDLLSRKLLRIAVEKAGKE